jgi:hypothetical protein
MLPTQKTPPKNDLSDLTVLAYAPSKFGKCLKGDTLLIDPGSARPITIESLVMQSDGDVLTMKDAGVITPQRPSAYLANEPAQLYRLSTQTGRTIEATANHPFLTRHGWKPLSELGPSDRVAVVVEYPQLFGNGDIEAESIRSSLYNIREAETQLDRLGPILFDRVISVEPTEVAPVFDLTIEGSHNFIANDFVVHNSTWCSQAEGALFLATEAGLNNLDVYQVPIGTWDDLLAACKEIADGKHPFKTIIIDTVDNAYRMCSEHVCQKFKIEHESDLGYGKGYALINNEFYRVLNKLALLPYGLFLVSHSQEKELETRTGKLTRIVPTLPEKARKIVLGMVDIILFGDLDTSVGEDGKPTTRRVLRTKPSLHYEAGDRTGRLPEVIDLDFKKFAEAYAAAQIKVTNSVTDSQIWSTASDMAASATAPPTQTAKSRQPINRQN